MRVDRQLTLVLVGAAVAGLAVVAAAGAAGASNHATNATGNESGVSVGAGQRLSTIISTTEDDVRTDVENTAVEVRLEGGTDAERVEALAERSEELRDRASDIQEEYGELTRAYESGDVSESEYAQRLAVLNGRAENVRRSLDSLRDRARNVSVPDVARVNESSVEQIKEGLDDVSGAGPDALLELFTGQRTGELEIRVDDGIRIEAGSEDGERSRELRRPDDGDDSISVAQSDALSTARSALSDQDGNWTLTGASVHEEDGYHRFEFRLATATEDGEAKIRIDGSSGKVLRVEEEIEGSDEGDANGEDGPEREPTLLVADGVPEPNATVTLSVRVGGEPVPDATVTRNGDVVGATGADGTLDVTLPPGESEFRTQVGDGDAELEFEFEEDGPESPDDERETEPEREGDDDDGQEEETEPDDDSQGHESSRSVSVDATLQDGTVTVTLTDGDGPIPDATASLEGDRVGVTDEDGEVSFSIASDTDDFDLEFAAGEFEVRTEYEVRNGSLVRTDGPAVRD